MKSAPATLHSLINSVLAGTDGLLCFLYMDDMIIMAGSLKSHNGRLRELLNLSNVSSWRPRFNSWYNVFPKRLLPHPKKTQYKIPPNQRPWNNLEDSWGYPRPIQFIQNYSKVKKTALQSAEKEHELGCKEAQQNAFQTLPNAVNYRTNFAVSGVFGTFHYYNRSTLWHCQLHIKPRRNKEGSPDRIC